MYLTNNPEVAAIAQDAGVARIVVDMEYIGKDKRQRGMNTSRNYHTIEDVKKLRPIIDKSELMVRVNPIHERTDKVISSEEEIEAVIEYGADIIMLPYFKTVQEVRTFIELVDHRAKVYPLIETPEAVDCMDEILKLDGIDEVHFGLNDLGLGYKKKFLFELRISFHLQLFSGIGTEIIRCLQKFASVIRKLQAGNIFICQFRLRVCIDPVDGHFKDDRLACQVGGAVVLGESQIQGNGLALLVADQAIIEAFDAHNIRTDFQMQALIASIVIFLSVHFSDVIDVDDVAFPYICPVCDFRLDLVIGHDLLDTVFHVLIRDFPFPGHFNRQV